MKRKGNLFEKIYSMENLRRADKKARRGKSKQKGIIEFDNNKENNLFKIHYELRSKTYKISQYRHIQIMEDKLRDISILPYRDRVVHHALMNIIEPILTSTFTSNTYSCIKGKGIHKASQNLRKSLKDTPNTTYCLKLDIEKFYPSVNGEILKKMLRRKIKCKNTLWLLDEIIDSHSGLPLGNFTSQPLANFYLAYFDHWIKEEQKIKHYFRYCDDLVILHSSKEFLHSILYKIKVYLLTKLNLKVKRNYKIFPVSARMIDFVGYPVNHHFVKLRKGIKKRFARILSKSKNSMSIPSYMGWLKHCNSKHLEQKLFQVCYK